MDRAYLLSGTPYRSQVGAQSWFLSKISPLLGEEYGKYSFIKLFNTFLLSLVFAVVFLWMRHAFGLIPSAIGIIFLTLSTGVNIFSGSLYWSIWLFILPLATVCVLDLCKVKNSWYIAVLLFPVFLFKFLSGFEFITTVVFAALTPHAWDFLVNKNGAALKRIFAVGFASIGAFVTSIWVYDTLFWKDFNSSGMDFIFGRSGYWSISHLYELGISPWLQLGKIFIMNFMDVYGYGLPLVGYFILAIAVIFSIRRIITRADLLFIVFLLVGSVSWLIIQPGHLLSHPRYATLMFFIPFGLFMPGFVSSLFLRRRTGKDHV